MSFKDLVLAGGKGGGGSFKNRPDNLRSTDSFEALIGIAGMRTSLAPGGLKNLFVNDVPIEDQNGHSSFEDFTAVHFDGDPTVLEPIKLVLGTSAGPNNINLQLTNPGTGGGGPWVTGAILQQNVDYIDLRFIVQQLFRQDKKGLYDATANIEVNLRPSGTSTWINPLIGTTAAPYNEDGTSDIKGVYKVLVQRMKYNSGGTAWADSGSTLRIAGKTTSPYVKELRIAVPNSDAYANKTWEVRCRLMERDYYVGGEDNLDEEHRDIVWESISGVSQDPLGGTEGWRGVSFVQVYGKASDQINGIPEITGIYDIGRYPVPPSTVFNASGQSYTGAAWDGVTTQLAWTQCPAWQIKALIEDDLAGVSALVPGSTLNKWDALEASKWFAERVPDGRGGEQPRYTANWVVEQAMQVNELVNYLAGAVGAFAWDEGDGRWRLKVEKPETPQMIFTKENIVGDFIYTHTDWDSRFNDITGVYRDRDNRYQENRVRVFNQSSIDATGRRHTTIALVGCDNRQEALRRTMLRLLTAMRETRIVSFTTNRQGALLEPFSVIGVADGDLNATVAMRSTGRIVSLAGDRKSFSVRDTLRLEPGVGYKIHLTIPNPEYDPETAAQPDHPDWRKPTITITRNVTNTTPQRGDVYDIFLDTALPENIPEFATVALEAVGLPSLPKQYRVISVLPDDGGETVAISATEIYTSKWVESDAVVEDQILAQTASKTVPPATAPAAGMFVLKEFQTEFAVRRLLSVNWQRPLLALMEGYRVEMQHNGGPWQDLGFTKETFVEMQDPAHGDYAFRIYVRDRKGRESEPLVGTYELTETALGGDGLSVMEKVVYKRSATAPATPTGGIFDFDSQTTTPPAGWSAEIPAGTEPVWASTAIASMRGNTGSADFGFWSTPNLVFQEGASVDVIFTRSASQPATPASSVGVPAGWYGDVASVPAGSNPLWSCFGSRSNSGAPWLWETPIKAQGVDGAAGAPGAPGANGQTLYTWYAYADAPDGTFNFTTGAPGSRFYQGIAVNKTTATESTNPADYVWAPYAGPPNFGLASFNSNTVLAGNKLIKVAGGVSWNGSVHSTESFKGGATVSFVVDTATQFMVGLNTDPTTDANYTSLDFAIYITATQAEVYESGAAKFAQAIAPVPGDVFTITYNNKTVVYSKNGVPFYTNSSPAANLVLFLDTSLAVPGTQLGRIISFGAAGQAGADGSAGAPGAPGANGITYYDWYAYADAPDGTYNFTTGAPGTRTYQGIAKGKTTATESTNPTDYVWAPYVGPPNFGLAAFNSNTPIAGNKLIKATGSTGWGNASVHSTESFKGGASVSFVIDTVDTFMAGLNTDPTTDASYTSLDFAIYIEANTSVKVYESSTVKYTGPAASVGDVFTITYNNKTVVYSRNGVPFYTNTSPAADLTLFLDTALYTSNRTFGRILSFTAAGTAGQDGTSPVSAAANPTSKQFNADADGTVKTGQLPFNVAISATKAGATITGTVTILEVSGGTASAISGGFTINSVTGDSGFVRWRFVASDGQVVENKMTFSRQRDPTSGGEISVNYNSITWFGSGSYAASGPSTVLPASSTGKLKLSAYTNFYVLGNGVANLTAKLQYRLVGSSTWLDTGFSGSGEAFKTPDIDNEPGENSPGDILIGGNLSGLTPNGSYEVQLVGNRTSVKSISSAAGFITLKQVL